MFLIRLTEQDKFLEIFSKCLIIFYGDADGKAADPKNSKKLIESLLEPKFEKNGSTHLGVLELNLVVLILDRTALRVDVCIV
jgi:hypothetical protein